MRTATRSLLVRLPNWVGDVVMVLPALRLLEAQGYRLQLLGKPWAASLLAGEHWPVTTYPSGYRHRIALLKQLAAEARATDPAFDRNINALVFPSSFSSAWEMRAAGLRAHGYRYEMRGFLLARALQLPKRVHKLEGYWRLACAFIQQAVDPPRQIDLRVAPGAQQRAQELLRSQAIERGYIVLCPFAGSNLQGHSKRWPHFAQFAALARKTWKQPVVVCPGPGEGADAHANFPGAIILDRVELAVYAALLKQADLVVTNDTGPGHMAAAVGARSLSVLGPTDPARYGPWGSTAQILTSPNGWPDIEQVKQAAETALRFEARIPVLEA